MKNLKIIFTISALVFVAACATHVQTYNPSGNDLSNYDTFAYLPNTNVDVEGKNYTDTIVAKTIVESVRLNLQKHGMELDRQNPDLLVLISTSTNVELGTDSEPVYATYPYDYRVGMVNPYYDPYYYHGYNTYTRVIGYNTSTYSYKEGTVVIDLIDKETKKTVWKGVANDQIYRQPTTQAVRELVDDIFAKFPVDEQGV